MCKLVGIGNIAILKEDAKKIITKDKLVYNELGIRLPAQTTYLTTTVKHDQELENKQM